MWLWPWVLTATGIAGMHLAGKRSSWGWAIGFLSEILWIVFSILTAQWGFLAGAAFYMWVFGKNWIEWRRDECIQRQARPRNRRSKRINEQLLGRQGSRGRPA